MRIAVENGWYHVLNGGIDGKWEESWKKSIKASVLHGTEEFVARMLKELKGDRREQTGMREKERLGLEWSKIVAASRKSGKRPGKRCPAKEAMEQWVWRITSDSGMRE